jgi:hypothetical protein
MNNLIRKLVRAVGMRLLTSKVRAAAEGRMGPGWQKAYWWFAGKKRVLAFVLAVGSGVSYAMGYEAVALGVVTAAGALLSLGFIDADWRTEAQESWVKDSFVWRALAHNAPLIVAAAGVGFAWLQGGECTLGEWCQRLNWILGAVMATFAHIGGQDAAWNAEPPKTGEVPQP